MNILDFEIKHGAANYQFKDFGFREYKDCYKYQANLYENLISLLINVDKNDNNVTVDVLDYDGSTYWPFYNEDMKRNNDVATLVGWTLLGKKFALTTVISSFTYPIALEAANHIFGDLVITTDPMLNTIFAGLGIGIGLGIVIRTGASTGGMDIPPLVLNKYFRIPVSVSLNVFDMLILVLQIVYNPPERVLYGVLLVMIYTTVLDKVLMMGNTKTEVKVISSQVEEIRQVILAQVDRGVTMLYGEGGYRQEQTQIVLSIVSNRELPRVEKLIRHIDPEAFMIVSRVTEVRGRGFSLSKHYGEEEA